MERNKKQSSPFKACAEKESSYLTKFFLLLYKINKRNKQEERARKGEAEAKK